jgi:hypothetical protein
MKSKYTLAIGLAATVAAGLSACVDLDEQIVSGVTADYYERPEGFEAAVNAAYAGLWDLYGEERDMTFLEYGVDIWSGGADGSRKQFNVYDQRIDPRESWLRDIWNDAYRHINTTNAVIGRRFRRRRRTSAWRKRASSAPCTTSTSSASSATSRSRWRRPRA